jgi:hypothetical protein
VLRQEGQSESMESWFLKQSSAAVDVSCFIHYNSGLNPD